MTTEPMPTGPTEPVPPTGPAPPGGPAGQRDRRGPATATVLVGALLVLVGIGWLLDAAGVEVPWRAVLPAALIAVGWPVSPGRSGAASTR
jgi:hypothetical protein